MIWSKTIFQKKTEFPQKNRFERGETKYVPILDGEGHTEHLFNNLTK